VLLTAAAHSWCLEGSHANALWCEVPLGFLTGQKVIFSFHSRRITIYPNISFLSPLVHSSSLQHLISTSFSSFIIFFSKFPSPNHWVYVTPSNKIPCMLFGLTSYMISSYQLKLEKSIIRQIFGSQRKCHRLYFVIYISGNARVPPRSLCYTYDIISTPPVIIRMFISPCLRTRNQTKAW